MVSSGRLFGVVLQSLFCASMLLADGPVPDDDYFDSRWADVERAFQGAKDSREFVAVREELRKFFSSPSQDLKALGLRWIGHHRRDLTADEMDSFSRLFIELNPDNSLSEGVRAELAKRHLAEAGTEERSAVYMAAVRNGSVKLEEVEEMPRFVALGSAAADGLEEFRPFIEQYREEIDGAYPADPYRRSEELLWMLKMRAGAKDRRDAVRLHAARLVEMDDDSFARLMDRDGAFRKATTSLLLSACEMRRSAPCSDMGRVALRQVKLRELQVKSGLRKQRAIPDGGDWLDGLLNLTGAARVKTEQRAD